MEVTNHLLNGMILQVPPFASNTVDGSNPAPAGMLKHWKQEDKLHILWCRPDFFHPVFLLGFFYKTDPETWLLNPLKQWLRFATVGWLPKKSKHIPTTMVMNPMVMNPMVLTQHAGWNREERKFQRYAGAACTYLSRHKGTNDCFD